MGKILAVALLVIVIGVVVAVRGAFLGVMADLFRDPTKGQKR